LELPEDDTDVSRHVGKRYRYPVTDPKAQRGGRGITLLFLDLGARRGWVVSTTPQTCRGDYNINIVKTKNIYCALLVEIKTIYKTHGTYEYTKICFRCCSLMAVDRRKT
jgi:hypothetical protein